MFKTLVILLLSFLLVQNLQAQQHISDHDTLVFYMNYTGITVTNKLDADYFLTILPPDSSSGVKLYPVYEFYPNGNRRMIAKSKIKDHNLLKYEGVCYLFYPNGNRKSVENYSDGKLMGEEIFYFKMDKSIL